MTPEGSTHISQAICIIGLLPFLVLGLGLVLGCLRALWYFVNWLRAQSLSTRWLLTTLPLTPVLVVFIGTCVEPQPGNITTCGLTFTVLSAISVGAVFAVSGVLHTFTVVKGLSSRSKHIPGWQKVLVVGVILDLMISGILRG